MGWRWRKSISLGGGTRTTMTSNGMGVSWGLAGLRIGRSPTGSLWVSASIPGTGISFFKYLSPKAPQATQQQSAIQAPPSPPPATSIPITANQRILEDIRRKKP